MMVIGLVWDLDKPSDHGVATELVGQFIARPKGRERKGSADACGRCNTAYEQRDCDRCSDLRKLDLMRSRGTARHDLLRPRNA